MKDKDTHDINVVEDNVSHDIIVAPVRRDALGRFPPGVSGNPGGHNKVALEIRRAFEANSMEAVELLWTLCNDSEDKNIQLKALMYWIDKAAGKLVDEIGNPITVTVDFIALLRKIADAGKGGP